MARNSSRALATVVDVSITRSCRTSYHARSPAFASEIPSESEGSNRHEIRHFRLLVAALLDALTERLERCDGVERVPVRRDERDVDEAHAIRSPEGAILDPVGLRPCELREHVFYQRFMLCDSIRLH